MWLSSSGLGHFQKMGRNASSNLANYTVLNAPLVELVDTSGLGPDTERCESSSLSGRTKLLRISQVWLRQRVLIPSSLVRIQHPLPVYKRKKMWECLCILGLPPVDG